MYSQEMSVGAAGVCVWWPKDDAGVNRLMDVTVPAGSGAGDTVEFADAEGNTLTAVVPDGLSEGDVFRVDELGMPVESTGSIMERFASWFEREEIGDQIDKFIRDNAGVLGTHRPRIDMNAEHSHDLWPLFQEYSARFDALLQTFLVEASCTAEEFLEAAKEAQGMQEIYVQLFLAHSEYEMFIELLSHEAVRQAAGED